MLDATKVVLSETLVLSKPAKRNVIHERITVDFSFQTSALIIEILPLLETKKIK